jgi:protocatechuate 3,4-dioxygenase beta subunit
MANDPPESPETLTRRDALNALLGLGAAMSLGCSTSSDAAANATRDAGAGADASASTGDGAACATTPEGEIGPYFADDSASGFNRSNILSNLDGTSTQSGIPLTLNITVVDAENGCAPYAGAQIDIWHCNAEGVYSDIAAESTSSAQWLRGYQITSASGQVTFQTIIPGWYSGRTTHIHLRVRSTYSEASSTSDGTNTTQCFFEQTFVDTLSTTVAPYNAEGTNPTTNAGDRVYSQEESGANQLVLTGDDTNGYTASVTLSLPITESYDAGAAAGGGAGGGPPDEGGAGGFPGEGGAMGPPGSAPADDASTDG